MSEENKGIKRKLEDESDECVFEIKGHFPDEVEFQFEDDTKLYASKFLLGYASPVFKAMFENGFKEGEQNSVVIEGFSRDEFREFLLHLEPGTTQPVDGNNYLRLTMLAVKYQCNLLVKRFQDKMKAQLKNATSGILSNSGLNGQVQPVLTCLQILQTAHALGLNDTSNLAIDAIARFAHCIYTDASGEYYTTKTSDVSDCYEIQNKCTAIFSQFNDELKVAIALKRLNKCSDFNFH